MVRIYKKKGKYIAESQRYTKAGNKPTWKKIQDKRGFVKKGSGYVLATDSKLSNLKSKLRKQGYYSYN
jgi:predicted nucleic acid-binding Zn ribbon protein